MILADECARTHWRAEQVAGARMPQFALLCLVLAACGTSRSPERDGFVARLGRDTVGVERVVRRANTLVSDEVDRFPRVRGADLIVNTQAGQWGTQYDEAHDLGLAPLHTEVLSAPIEKFSITVVGADDRHGSLVLEWGTFRWTAPIVVR